MKIIFKSFLVFIIAFLSFSSSIAFCAFEKIDGLEYDLRKLTDAPLDRLIAKRYELYELYFENRSQNTFSIPGYSIDVGVEYFTLNELQSLYKDKSNKKMAVFNIAANAASIAFGGITRTATNAAARSVGLFRLKKGALDDVDIYLNPAKTYVLYPNDSLSLLFFVDKFIAESPNKIRLICRDENSNKTNILINNNLSVKELNSNDDGNMTLVAPGSDILK